MFHIEWLIYPLHMKFIDTEVSLQRQEISDIGGINDNGNSFHSNSVSEFISYIRGTKFICGHNILNHDLKHLQKAQQIVFG